ncbi:hypothetical protein H5410_020269 [Solanum commersonii]|uniref:Uncharacterized protein n=1 Tax=Solanum commersonii TaxID=4109 RepID=A0A9J5ZBY8_SOLCO|nr:hypothetical protein H5410_020269 [Solanum commersonii]
MNRKFGGGKPPTGTPSMAWSTVVVVVSLLAGASVVHNFFKPDLALPTKLQTGLEICFSDVTHEVGVEVTLDTQVVPKRDRFKNLGSLIHGNGEIDDAVTYCISAAWMK